MTSTETNQVYVTFIQATPERIWAAITQPEHGAKYFNGDGWTVLSELKTYLETDRPWRTA